MREALPPHEESHNEPPAEELINGAIDQIDVGETAEIDERRFSTPNAVGFIVLTSCLMPRGGNFKTVRENLAKQGKLNSQQPMSAEQKRARRRKSKSKRKKTK